MVVLSKIKLNWKIGVGVVLGLIGVGILGFFGWKYQHDQWLSKNPQEAAVEETNNLVKQVSKLTVLPMGETPTIATVFDKSRLAGQPFFIRAEEGDKVLIFAKEGRAILYRPSTNRIVEITTMVQPTVTPEAQLSEATMAIYNGTQTQGLATVAEKSIAASMKNIKITAKQNSVGEYTKSMVIVFNPKAKNLATQLGSLLKAEVSEKLPDGEVKPEADLLLILGEEYKKVY